ncbi:hypothetical protein Tco_1393968 [Tanacetum coccineum]
MSDLKFADTHNLVAFLEKPIESEGFEEILWDTVKVKMVNGEGQLQALVDKKKVIITESTIRRDLQLEDAEEPMADETENVESVPTHSNDPLLSGEDSLKLNELMELCTNLQKKVLDLETTKTIQALEIDSLKIRVKKLKKNLDLYGNEVFVETQEHVVNAATTISTIPVSVASATTTTVDELTMAQTLIEIRAAKPKVKVHKGKGKITEFEKPLKKKDQIIYDQEVALNLQAQLQAELEEEERLVRQKEKEANIALIESWDNTEAIMDAERLLAERLQAREQKELTDKEKARLFVELLEKRKKHFAALRAIEKRNKPPTKVQKKSTMSTYLKHMAGYKQSQLKNKSFAEIKKLFDKAMTRVNMFVDMDIKQEKAKKQKIDDDQEEAKQKELMEVIYDEEGVAIDAIPLSTKPPRIVDYTIIKEGKISIFQIIRADGSSKRYSAVIHMLKKFDKEYLETLWKIVKARHVYTRPEEGYERVLWGYLETMFEHHVEDLVWRVSAAGTKLQLLKDYNYLRIKTAEKIKIDWSYP